VQESKSKLELFYRMFIKLFCHIFFALGLNTCFNEFKTIGTYTKEIQRLSCAEVVLTDKVYGACWLRVASWRSLQWIHSLEKLKLNNYLLLFCFFVIFHFLIFCLLLTF